MYVLRETCRKSGYQPCLAKRHWSAKYSRGILSGGCLWYCGCAWYWSGWPAECCQFSGSHESKEAVRCRGFVCPNNPHPIKNTPSQEIIVPVWGCVTVWLGRALEWHSRGQRFDPAYLHHKSLKKLWKTSFWKQNEVFSFLFLSLHADLAFTHPLLEWYPHNPARGGTGRG